MSDSEQAAGAHTWPYAAGGALVMFAVVVLANAGDYEGGDAVLVLGSITALVGGSVGALIGRLINGHRRAR